MDGICSIINNELCITYSNHLSIGIKGDNPYLPNLSLTIPPAPLVENF